MTYLILINNKNGQRFVKKFNSPYLANKFKIKVNKGKSITYVGEWEE